VLDLPVCRRTREHKVGHPWRCPRYRFEQA
jgi:hypothetical protein